MRSSYASRVGAGTGRRDAVMGCRPARSRRGLAGHVMMNVDDPLRDSRLRRRPRARRTGRRGCPGRPDPARHHRRPRRGQVHAGGARWPPAVAARGRGADGRLPPRRRRAAPARAAATARARRRRSTPGGTPRCCAGCATEPRPRGAGARRSSATWSSRSPARSPVPPGAGWWSPRATTCCSTSREWRAVRAPARRGVARRHRRRRPAARGWWPGTSRSARRPARGRAPGSTGSTSRTPGWSRPRGERADVRPGPDPVAGLSGYFGGIRMPPSTRTVSPFM